MKQNKWAAPILGEFQQVDGEDEFILSGGTEKVRATIAQASALLVPGRRYGCTQQDSLIANREQLDKIIDGMIATHVKAQMITGVQLFADSRNHVLSINGDQTNFYDPEEIIKGQGVEFKNARGQLMSQDLSKIALKAFNTNQLTIKAIENLMTNFAQAISDLQAANRVIQTKYITGK